MANHPLNILLVDDEESAAILFRLVAERDRNNIHLEVADSGQKAIEYLSGRGPFSDRANHPLPDVMVIDLLMPGITGFDVLEWCQKHPELGGIPRIVFSGSLRESDEREAVARGATRFIRKPTALPEFRAVVHEILDYGERSRQ